MQVAKAETAPVRTESDIVNVRQMTRVWSTECKFSLVDQTKIVTAASELARNAVNYGGGGTVKLEILSDGVRKGLRLTFSDHGPGISGAAAERPDPTALHGRGLWLADQLCDGMQISATSRGTTVRLVMNR